MGMNPAAINFPDDIDTGKVIQAIEARKRVLLQEDNSSPIEYKVIFLRQEKSNLLL